MNSYRQVGAAAAAAAAGICSFKSQWTFLFLSSPPSFRAL